MDFCIEWNAENELTRVTKNAVEQARFKYDPLGRRVEKVAGGATTTWTYDAEDILREISGATTLKYFQGEDVDEPLAREDASGVVSYYHADGLGSVVKLTDSAGAVTLTRQYDDWGNQQIGATNPGYAFTGREWDPETGLYYYRARYYDPRVGRFASEDPLQGAAGPNFFTYADGDPVGLTDPLGLAVASPWVWPKKPGPGASAWDRMWWGLQCISIAFSFNDMAAPMTVTPYRRPSGATTAAQRAAVQGQACAVCGEAAEKMYAGHKNPLVREYFETGTVDKAKMRDIDAVRPECPTCSNREGGFMSQFSKMMKQLFGL